VHTEKMDLTQLSLLVNVALFKYLINVTPKKSFYVFNTINGKKGLM